MPHAITPESLTPTLGAADTQGLTQQEVVQYSAQWLGATPQRSGPGFGNREATAQSTTFGGFTWTKTGESSSTLVLLPPDNSPYHGQVIYISKWHYDTTAESPRSRHFVHVSHIGSRLQLYIGFASENLTIYTRVTAQGSWIQGPITTATRYSQAVANIRRLASWLSHD